MSRVIGIYGTISGVTLVSLFQLTLALGLHKSANGMVVGYLTMLVALSLVFVGVKRYRDTDLGGVIRFWPALGIGCAIAGIAALFYVIGWEAYMFATDYTFLDEYIKETVAAKQAAGATASDIAKFKAEMGAIAVQYRNPLFRMLFTLAEIAPVGLLVALISAAVLRNSRAFPARVARA